MKIIPIKQTEVDPDILSRAVEFLRNEDAIIHPTETVYGIAGQYNSEKLLQKINSAKSRQADQPFSIMVDSIDQMLDLSGQGSDWLRQILTSLFPNPLTVLIPRRKKIGISYWDRFPLIGFRCPDHLWSRALIQQVGVPLITTSANHHGERPARSISEIPAALISEVALILDGGTTRYQLPSTIIIIDLIKSEVEIVRSGAMPGNVIQDLIKKSG